MKYLCELWFQGTAVVDNLVVGQSSYLILRPLAPNPFLSLLTGDVVTLDDALDTYLFWGGDNDDAVNNMGDASLIENGR